MAKEKQKPDLSMFGVEELFEEIKSRVTGAVLILEHPPYHANMPGSVISIYSSIPPSFAIGMMARAQHKFVAG